jgi:hypothetical protein
MSSSTQWSSKAWHSSTQWSSKAWHDTKNENVEEGNGKDAGKKGKGNTSAPNGRRLKEPKYDKHGRVVPYTQYGQCNYMARLKRFTDREAVQNLYMSLTTEQQLEYNKNKEHYGTLQNYLLSLPGN